MDNKDLSVKFKWKQRSGLWFTEFGRQTGDFIITSYLMVFLTDAAKVPVAAISLMFLICKIFDAFTDYLVGVLVDRTRNKMGRSRSWLYIGIFVLSIGLIMIFREPFESNTGKIVWMYITYLIETFGMTLIAIPEGALIPALSADVKERTVLASMRGTAGSLASLFSSNIVAVLINKFGSGDSVLAYGRMAMVIAAITFVCILVGNSLIREINLPPMQNKNAKQKNNVLLSDLKYLFTDKYYLIVLIPNYS